MTAQGGVLGKRIDPNFFLDGDSSQFKLVLPSLLLTSNLVIAGASFACMRFMPNASLCRNFCITQAFFFKYVLGM